MTYFVAAVVVLYNVEDQSQRHYLGKMQHNPYFKSYYFVDPVFSPLQVILLCLPCICRRPHPGHPLHECSPQQAAHSHGPGGGRGQGSRQVRAYYKSVYFADPVFNPYNRGIGI